MGFELDNDERVFSEPWEAQAFAIAVTLSGDGHFTWKEWAETLAAVIAKSKANGGPLDGSDYYLNWVQALELLVTEKGISNSAYLSTTKAAWENAYKLTPHGKPVHLKH